ncbi:hypothetical protein BTO15_01600 [Polaribacter sejongensis]|uniref:DUF2158 domain-containing protein n=1 Tax=Polaribacter sejongensis TaxID=985043 RepID=A0ABM6PVZ8_9FLAO|nr:hypothetical protein [Polaribacter sejongensis]AUC20886.1 hypothetical protein BTO15_01600 [Polaribacter sejongensis]
MRTYTFKDFEIGVSVYHKSNTRIKMIVVGKDSETFELKCRWIDKDGNRLEDIFLFAELVKSDDHDYDTRPRFSVI